jgi:hypothetical protein
MFGLFCFVLAVLASSFKSKSRLEAENAALEQVEANGRGNEQIHSGNVWRFSSSVLIQTENEMRSKKLTFKFYPASKGVVPAAARRKWSRIIRWCCLEAKWSDRSCLRCCSNGLEEVPI